MCHYKKYVHFYLGTCFVSECAQLQQAVQGSAKISNYRAIFQLFDETATIAWLRCGYGSFRLRWLAPCGVFWLY